MAMTSSRANGDSSTVVNIFPAAIHQEQGGGKLDGFFVVVLLCLLQPEQNLQLQQSTLWLTLQRRLCRVLFAFALKRLSFVSNNGLLSPNGYLLPHQKKNVTQLVHRKMFFHAIYVFLWWCVERSPYAHHPVSQKLPKRCLWISSNVCLTDDDAFSFFEGRSSWASSSYASLLQALTGPKPECRHTAVFENPTLSTEVRSFRKIHAKNITVLLDK